MRRLSAPEQDVLLHVVQLGLSHDEAAYVLAMPPGTVKSHTKPSICQIARNAG
ncbi:MAG: hypothetical protein K2X44_07460 [Magnetospirillum sp.]|nr:hypothetical protein [Magnetospirillum sp.]